MIQIMIVEDNPIARRALKALISQQEGLKVTAEASNGREAIQSLHRKLPDVVLLDMQMPVMNGLDATKAIKDKWPQVRVIVLTMYPDHQQEVMQAGADAFLMKGCPVEEVTAAIHASRETPPSATQSPAPLAIFKSGNPFQHIKSIDILQCESLARPLA